MAKSDKAELYKQKIASRVGKWGYASVFNTKKEKGYLYYWIELYVIKKKMADDDLAIKIKDIENYAKLGLTYLCVGTDKTIDGAYRDLLRKVDMIGTKMNLIKDKQNG
jgi:hypothetical protein